MAKIFIDGEHGTTGLRIAQRLAERDDIQLLSLPDETRKSASHRQQMLNAADVVILCLPDDAAKEAVSWITNPAVRVIDTSTAHRTHRDWIYGFPELQPGQREAVAHASRVANPGCYATGAIALLKPLVDKGIVPAGLPLNLVGVSGYTGGGKSLIKVHEGTDPEPFALYALGLSHKHLPEIMRYAGLTTKPVFIPSEGHFPTGMLVTIPLHRSLLKGSAADAWKVLADHYKNERFVSVRALGDRGMLERNDFLRPDRLSDTNNLELMLFHSEAGEEILLVARLDNLGKGASGAAIQNLNLMLGKAEHIGLQ